MGSGQLSMYCIVGDEVPGAVAVLCECVSGWVKQAQNQLNACQNFNLLKQMNK